MLNKNLIKGIIFFFGLVAFTALSLVAGKPSAQNFSLNVTTNTTNYYGGDSVLVTAVATYDDSSPVTETRNADITIKDVSGTAVHTGTLTNGGNGTFTYSYTLPGAASGGTWTAEVVIQDANRTERSGSATFQVQSGGNHDGLTWTGYDTCLACHADKAQEIHSSVHYQWSGATPDMTNHPNMPQGKVYEAVNSYCINIMGNWNVCGKCHIGAGAQPTAQQQLDNIDCLMCHQKEYKRVRASVDGPFVPDTANMTISMDVAVQTVHRPERQNCLQCHANAGGGDAVKRGDLAMASVNTGDFNYDVHMSHSGADLTCYSCHTFTNHRVLGKGSDLRPTDREGILECSACHIEKTTPTGHNTSKVADHTARVACQTCHIPVYAKNASDTAATEATETHRTWVSTTATAAPYHPHMDKANDLMPKYEFWNRYSNNYVLFDNAVMDPVTGYFPTSRPEGAIDDANSKIYPFKYKTAEMPMITATQQMIALDTSVYFATGDGTAATLQGLTNMGFSQNTPYEWIYTDTYQLLNHQVSPQTQALACSDCHQNTSRMDLPAMGYALKDTEAVVCSQCHTSKRNKGFEWAHSRHVDSGGWDCSWCHDFSRPERGLTLPN